MKRGKKEGGGFLQVAFWGRLGSNDGRLQGRVGVMGRGKVVITFATVYHLSGSSVGG